MIRTTCMILLAGTTATAALADTDHSIAAEQVTNKPGDGPYISDTGVEIELATTSEGTTHGDGKKLYKESSRETRPQSVAFYVWGKLDSTASFVLTFKAGGTKKLGTIGCSAPDIREETGREQVRCDRDEGTALEDRFDLAMGPGLHTIDIGLKDPETGKVRMLRTLKFKVASAPYGNDKGRTAWFVDRDHQIGEHMAMWLAPTELALLSWVKSDKPDAFSKPESNVLKCAKNGKPFTIPNESYAGFVSTEEGKQITTTNNRVFGWSRLSAKLIVEREKAEGTWECKAFAGGKLWRTFKFVVGADGRLAKSPQQAKIVAPSVYLPETVMAPGVDATYDKAAFKARGFWGKPI